MDAHPLYHAGMRRLQQAHETVPIAEPARDRGAGPEAP
jgi:hypothetical protein